MFEVTLLQLPASPQPHMRAHDPHGEGEREGMG